jgi:hypothetical protein
MEAGRQQRQTKVLRQLCPPWTVGEKTREHRVDLTSSRAEHEVLSATPGSKEFGGGR